MALLGSVVWYYRQLSSTAKQRRTFLRGYTPAALGEIFARARALQQFLGGGALSRQFVQLGDFSARQRLTPRGRRGTFAESIKKLPSFGEAEAAGFGALQHGESLQDRWTVLPPTAAADRPRQHARLLVIADRRSGKPGFLRHLPNRHSNKFT